MAVEEPKCKSDPRIEQLAEALKALSEPHRLRIICCLTHGEKCVCDVEEELGISQQLTSHHLGVLRDAGFLKTWKEGTSSRYAIDVDYLKLIDETFSEYIDYRKVTGERPPC